MGSFKDVVGHKEYYRIYSERSGRNTGVSCVHSEWGDVVPGKKMLASCLQRRFCVRNRDSEPCNKCHSCRQADSG